MDPIESLFRHHLGYRLYILPFSILLFLAEFVSCQAFPFGTGR